MSRGAPTRVPAPRGSWRLGSAGGRYALLVDKRACGANLGLLIALLAACIAALCLGSVAIAPDDALRALFGRGDAMTVFVVQQLRLARLGAGVLTGAAFALAGCLMQTLTGNRLATPGIIGINYGATAFAVGAVVSMTTTLSPSLMALAGGAVTAALTFALAGGVGLRGYRFIIAGIGVGAAARAITQLMLARAPIDSANAAYPWTVGSLNAVDADALRLLGLGLAVATPAALALSRSLATLRFADAVATGLGVAVNRCRWSALALAVLLSALAVAVAGPVALIALMGPEIARHLSSRRGVPLVAGMLAGALVMVCADLAGRLLLAPVEIPVGLITVIVGGPFLLWILLRPTHRIAP